MNALEQVSAQVLEAMRKREQDYMERKAPGYTDTTPEQIAFSKAYWEAVFSDKPSNAGLTMSRSTRQELEYDHARRKFWAILQLRAAHIEVLDNSEFSWRFDENEKRILQNLVKYFSNDASCEWPLTKGLFLYGAPGTGKSEMMSECSIF